MAEPDYERFATGEVLDNPGHVVAVIDAGMVVRWVSHSAALYGLDPIGRHLAELIHPADLEWIAPAFTIVADPAQPDPSLAFAPLALRVVGPTGTLSFDARARSMSDDEGRRWLVVTLHDVTTRQAIDGALRALAAGADEHESIRAVVSASRSYAGVSGAQVSWHSDGRMHTVGDLAPDEVAEVLASVGPVHPGGCAITIPGSDWGFVLPLLAANERLGVTIWWGIGPAPSIEFVAGAFAPLVDVAVLALTRTRVHAELRRQATTDLATGLLNRHAFFAALNGSAPRTAILYIDLDGFKAVNDEFGHTLGDRLLSVVARRLVDAVADDDIIGRIGGDEFAVLCRSVSAAQARAIGERVIEALNQTFAVDGHRLVTGASVGIAYAHESTDLRLLLDFADQALLEAKAQGKGRTVVLAAL